MKQCELDYDKVKEMYVDKKMSASKCAKELGVNPRTLDKFLINNGLKIVSKKNDVPDLMETLKPKEDLPKKDSKKKSQKSSTKKSNSSDNKVFSLKEKTAFANKLYGKGNWEFISREELREMLASDLLVDFY